MNGFYLKVFISGAKVFFIRYRLGDGRRFKLKIGRADALTNFEAREQAKKILAEVAIGKDPEASKYTQENKIPTLEQFIKEQYQSWCESHLQSPDKQLEKLYRFHDFLKMPLDEINPQKVEKWRSACLKKGQAPATVNRNLVVLKSVLSKAVQ